MYFYLMRYNLNFSGLEDSSLPLMTTIWVKLVEPIYKINQGYKIYKLPKNVNLVIWNSSVFGMKTDNLVATNFDGEEIAGDSGAL